MNQSRWACALYNFLGLFLLAAPGVQSQALKLPARGSAVGGPQRNLFAERGHASKEIGAKVNAAFDQFFFGTLDPAGKLYFQSSPTEAYIRTANDDVTDMAGHTASGTVHTEEISYALMIFVQLGKRAEFDNLWRFTKHYLRHNDGLFAGTYNWRIGPDFRPFPAGDAAAADNNEWLAASLIMASGRWGDREIPYLAEARSILDAMLHVEDHNGGIAYQNNYEGVPRFEVWAHNQISFPNSYHAAGAYEPVYDTTTDGPGFTDPKYCTPAFYEMFARVAVPKDRAVWAKVRDETRDVLLPRQADAVTRLGPEYAEFHSGVPRPGSDGQAVYSYDAWMTTENIAMDYAWWHTPAWGKPSPMTKQADRLLAFFAGQIRDHQGIADSYALNGKARGGYGIVPGHLAMIATAALAADTADSGTFADRLWSLPTPTDKQDYINLDYMLGLLQLSGNWRVYLPQTTDKRSRKIQ